MRKLSHLILIAACLTYARPLRAQQPCPGFSVVVNTPEDELMLAVNGAENPQEQVAALEKFANEHADSKFIPCVNEYLTTAYSKLNNYDKAIEYGEKDLGVSYLDVNLMLNLARAYVAGGKASDAAFDMIFKAPEQIKAESNPSKPSSVSDAEWQKSLQELTEQVEGWRANMEYSFFQLLPRVTEGNKRVQLLDSFIKSYPESKNAAKINLHYFLAYQMANNPAKAAEYGEKAVASDPTNVETLNAVADYYATTLQTNLEKATDYAKRVLDVAAAMKKPESMSEGDFKSYRDNHLGLAHATLGYIAFLKGNKTHKVAPAIQEFKTAADLLAANPTLQGRTLYYLGYAYEVLIPPSHKLAAEALTRAVAINNPWQGQANDLLSKVKKATGQ